MSEHAEPTNEQLARFLTVYIPSQMGQDLNPSPVILERLLETQSGLREKALEHHRRFQAQIDELDRRMKLGELPCAYIRTNGKPCPNRNQPGSYYCGLHIDEEVL